MKSVKAFVMLVGVALTIASCSKNDIPEPMVNDSATEILAKIPESGVYAVVKFIENGDDHTSQIGECTYEFQSDGALVVTNMADSSFYGTWSMNLEETVLTISVEGNDVVDDLNKDWNVVRITNKRIRLTSDDGNDHVLFHKVE